MCMWHLGTWCNAGLASAGFMVGLDDIEGLFKPKQFYDFMVFLKDCSFFLGIPVMGIPLHFSG